MSSLYGIELFFFGGDKNCHQMIFCTHHVVELPPRITTIKISALHTNMQQLQKSQHFPLYAHDKHFNAHSRRKNKKNVFVIYGTATPTNVHFIKIVSCG